MATQAAQAVEQLRPLWIHRKQPTGSVMLFRQSQRVPLKEHAILAGTFERPSMAGLEEEEKNVIKYFKYLIQSIQRYFIIFS